MAFRDSQRVLDACVTPTGAIRVAAVHERLVYAPRCAIGRFLLSVWHFDEQRPALAVQGWMLTYRACCELESATLLAFFGLHLIHSRSAVLLDALADVEREFHHPPFDRTRLERTLLDRLAAGNTGASPPSRLQRAWRLPLRALREEVRLAAAHASSAVNTAHPAPA